MTTRSLMIACCFSAAVVGCNSRSAETSTKKAVHRVSDGEKCTVASPSEPPPPAAPASNCPLDPVFGGVSMKRAELVFKGVSPPKSISVELAVSEDERARGLMYRTRLADGTGMLFVSKGEERVQSFWMRNTCIPLDMMFIDKSGYIAGILENVPPMNDERRSIPCPVRYVLEVPGGWSRKVGVKAGQYVTLPKP